MITFLIGVLGAGCLAGSLTGGRHPRRTELVMSPVRDMDVVAFTQSAAQKDVLVVAFRAGTSDADCAEWVTENLGPALHIHRLPAAETAAIVRKFPAEVEHLARDLGEGYDVACRRVQYDARADGGRS